MSKYLIIVIVVTSFYNTAYAKRLFFAEGYAGLSYMFSDLTYKPTTGDQYEYYGPSYGLEIGLRGGLETGKFVQLGVLGCVAYSHMEGNNRTINSDRSNRTYDNDLTQTLTGAFINVGTTIKAVMEYYNHFSQNVYWAEETGNNLFEDNGYWRGKGYGLGVRFENGDEAQTLLFRRITIDKAKFLNGSTDFEDDVFNSPNVIQVVLEVSDKF